MLLTVRSVRCRGRVARLTSKPEVIGRPSDYYRQTPLWSLTGTDSPIVGVRAEAQPLESDRPVLL
jgi:hypothetical protein